MTVRIVRFVATVACAVLVSSCGLMANHSNWSEADLEKQGAALVKQESNTDTTIDCKGGLTNQQGNSIMCTDKEGQKWLFWPDSQGELNVRKGQGG
jgi:hypothetical protein